MKKYLAYFSGFVALVPSIVYASATAVSVPNHSKWQSISQLAANILRLLVIVSGASFFVFFAIGGLQYLYSAGDPAQVQKAKGTLVWSIVGFVVVVIGYVALNWISKFFGYSI